MATKLKLNSKKLSQLIEANKSEVQRRTIADGVEYGVYQEFTASGHPSLGPAFERVTKDLPEIIGAAIEAGVNLDAVIDKAAFDVQTLWTKDVNVDTSAYRNSIHVEVG